MLSAEKARARDRMAFCHGHSFSTVEQSTYAALGVVENNMGRTPTQPRNANRRPYTVIDAANDTYRTPTSEGEGVGNILQQNVRMEVYSAVRRGIVVFLKIPPVSACRRKLATPCDRMSMMNQGSDIETEVEKIKGARGDE